MSEEPGFGLPSARAGLHTLEQFGKPKPLQNTSLSARLVGSSEAFVSRIRLSECRGVLLPPVAAAPGCGRSFRELGKPVEMCV
ncbi:MAG TPA: hypothetical protein VIL56_05840, partial [Gaiellaceae bacterium]